MNNHATPDLPFTRKNILIFLIGLATILLGYVLLRIPPADGVASLTLAPLLLVIGYCVVIPAAILWKDPGSAPE